MTSTLASRIVQSLRVVVGSGTNIKISAVKAAFETALTALNSTSDSSQFCDSVTVDGVKAESRINEQPLGHEETLQGALNRLEHTKGLSPSADFYVAIENGIFCIPVNGTERFFDLAWVVVERACDGQQAFSHSSGLEFDSGLVHEVEGSDGKGFIGNTVGSRIAEVVPGVHKQ